MLTNMLIYAFIVIMTTAQQTSRINNALYEIHRDISAPHSAKKLARIAAYSEQHFHRVFKAVVGETVNNYIRRTRLEHAANQLMFDDQSSVLEIAEKCGFNSLSSFIKVFSASFNVTPGVWRNSNRAQHPQHYLSEPRLAEGYARTKQQPLGTPDIIYRPPQTAVYVRHKGYGKSIKKAWQVLLSWARTHHIANNTTEQIGLHHSNPAWTPLQECRYVACLTINKPIVRRGVINTLTIPGGDYAVFNLQGQYGDLVPYMDKILTQWLPHSGFILDTTPILAIYQKNHFISQDEKFDLQLCFPVSIV